MDPASGAFWAALGSIIVANLLLSGDNAVVIAMAARALPARQQKPAIVWGSVAAIAMRTGLTLLAVELLEWPGLKVVGAALLLWIGISLLREGERPPPGAGEIVGVGAAVRTILFADLVMSLDNVLAVAAAANGDKLLLAIGLAVSIPLIVFGSSLLLTAMERFPIILTLGGGLLGYLAGEMLLSDPAVIARFGEPSGAVDAIAGGIGAALVVGIGRWLRPRAASRIAD